MLHYFSLLSVLNALFIWVKHQSEWSEFTLWFLSLFNKLKDTLHSLNHHLSHVIIKKSELADIFQIWTLIHDILFIQYTYYALFSVIDN